MSMESRNYSLDQLKNQLSLARNEIKNLRQQLKTLNHLHKKECDEIYEKLNKLNCSGSHVNSSTNKMNTDSDNAPSTSEQNSLPLRYIGLIRTQFPSKRGTPRQPSICSDATGVLTLNNDVFTNPQHALEGLEQFSHMWIIFHFHKTESTHIPAKVAPPRLNGLKMGVFGTRSPHRPSPIGLSLVKINQITGNVIHFSGVDMMDQTPVLDIKPYIPQYDSPNQHSLYYSESALCENSDEEVMRPPSGDGQPIDDSQNIDNGSVQNDVRTLEGQENERSNVVPGAIANETSRYLTFEAIRPNSRMGEREAPDGEEEGPDMSQNPPNRSTSTLPSSYSDASRISVRVPRWIENPVVPPLSVSFKMAAEIQLRQMGVEGEEKKGIIRNILSEDPRSVYLRERQGDSPYVFRIADLHVSCGFNDEERMVSVFQVVRCDVAEPSEDS